jgi:hypothetical protein
MPISTQIKRHLVRVQTKFFSVANCDPLHANPQHHSILDQYYPLTTVAFLHGVAHYVLYRPQGQYNNLLYSFYAS